MELISEGGYRFVCQGKGPSIVLLHGLFGNLSNWEAVVPVLSSRFQVWLPMLPIYEGHHVEPNVRSLAVYISQFIQQLISKPVNLIGNSLGGHIALLIALNYPQLVKTLILTGSSGLFENQMGNSLPRRQDVAYLRERIGYTFYSPATVTDALVHEIITVINNREAAMRIIHISRSAQKMNLKADLSKIIHPCGLIWGLNDNITPPMVAHEFRRGLSHAELYFIDRCGHAAMMEQPARFNELVLSFLNRFESTRIPNESGTKTVRI